MTTSVEDHKKFFGRIFNYANNALTIAGVVLTTISGLLIIVFLSAQLWGGLDNPYIGLFAYVVLPMVFILGLIDDRRGLDWRVRIAVQTLVAGAMVSLGWRLSLFLDVSWLTAILSVVWIVGLINSFNMLDNMDGLSAGTAAIAAGLLAVVMLTVSEAGADQPQLFVGCFISRKSNVPVGNATTPDPN